MNIGLRRLGIWFLSAFFRKALTVIGHFLLMNSFIFYADDKKLFENPTSGSRLRRDRVAPRPSGKPDLGFWNHF